MSDRAVSSRDRAEDGAWFKLNKPVDLGAILQAVVIIVGGIYALATMSAKIDAMSGQFSVFQDHTERSLAHIEDRIDNIVDGDPKSTRR